MTPGQQGPPPEHQFTFVDHGITNVGSFDADRSELPAWVVLGLCIASGIGAVIGIAAYPGWWVLITATALVQVLVSLAGLLGSPRPVAWAVVVAVVGLGSAVVHPVLGDLAHSGAVPWIGLSTAAATLNLYLNARAWGALTVGSAALILGSSGLAVANIRAGTPVATAIMAASIYLLLGVLAAFSLQLRNARQDRLRRLAPSARSSTEAADGELAGARRALAIVALRSDELIASSSENSVRHVGADLREVAQRALAAEGAGGGRAGRVTQIEIRPVPPAAGTDEPAAEPSQTPAMPQLADRDREILRLVATGAPNAAIARSLYLSEATVKQYVSKLMRRFDRENRTQLAVMAARWFDPELQ